MSNLVDGLNAGRLSQIALLLYQMIEFVVFQPKMAETLYLPFRLWKPWNMFT
jgi:hypothetical protein